MAGCVERLVAASGMDFSGNSISLSIFFLCYCLLCVNFPQQIILLFNKNKIVKPSQK
jgi:hypothetical protein